MEHDPYTISVLTSNILATDLMSDICESPAETAARYEMAVKFYQESLVDFILVQEADELVAEIMYNNGMTTLIKDMSARSDGSRLLIIIWNPLIWQLVQDITEDCQAAYEQSHGNYPFRGQAAMFMRADGVGCGICNVHGAGKFPKVLEDVLDIILPIFDESIPVIIGGDMYSTPAAQCEPYGFKIAMSYYATASHDFTTDKDGNIVYLPHRTKPDLFLYRGLKQPKLSLQGDFEAPYKYIEACGPGTYTMSQLDQCRNSSLVSPYVVSKPKHFSKTCHKYTRKTKAVASNWFSDHKAFNAVFWL